MRAVLCGLTAAWLVAFAVSGALAGEPNINGLWRGSLFGADVRVQVDQNERDVKVEAIVHDMTGETNVYHFFGVMENGHMVLTHGSGHKFEGDARGDDIVGVLTTKGGTRVDIRASRTPRPETGQGSMGQGAAGAGRRPG